MRIVLLNPFLGSAVRRRHTTLISLRERGQEIELLFTSLRAMSALAKQLSEAVSEMLDGGEGAEWINPSVAVRRRARDEASDLLYDAGLLDRPGFMRRRPVIEPVTGPRPRHPAPAAKPAGGAGDPPSGR